ncbi:MAG: FliI/YscN family ATPase, partial [Pseudomonadota bacterium]
MTIDSVANALRQATTLRKIGRVVQARGTVIRVSGLPARIGELCRISNPNEQWSMHAEVVGLEAGAALLVPLGQLRNLSPDAQVECLPSSTSVAVGTDLLGRVLNANGTPIDNDTPTHGLVEQDIYGLPPDALKRKSIEQVHVTGIRAIDGLLTIGRGQRVGIFAPAGCGKSTLLGMLTNSKDTDVNVVALIGERGREVNDFIAENLKDQKTRTVLVVSTSDQPPLFKVRALNTATAIAEYFRDQGHAVQLLVDSVTRYARALRDIGLAAGEPPTRQGYPPSVFSTLPEILERSGNNHTGSITAFYTVLNEGDLQADPVA